MDKPSKEELETLTAPSDEQVQAAIQAAAEEYKAEEYKAALDALTQPVPDAPIPWRDRFTDRQLRHINWCRTYDGHGAPGHLPTTIIAKMAKLLDDPDMPLEFSSIEELEEMLHDAQQRNRPT